MNDTAHINRRIHNNSIVYCIIEGRRNGFKEKEEELDKNSSLMTRIDLTDLNDARTKVNRLEGACEALDIIRTAVLGAESKIQRTEETTA